jgi:uncharacterized protein (DUF58 family)
MIRPIRTHFFNAIWLYTAGALLVLGMIIGQPAISLLAAAVFITAGLTWLWTRQALVGLEFDRYLSNTRAFRGETLTVTFKLENTGWLPLAWVEVDEHISDRVRPKQLAGMPSDRIGSTIVRHATPLRWKQRVTWTVELECDERGVHDIGPTSLRSGDPFGFFTRQKLIERMRSFLVYPDVVPLKEMQFPPNFPFGVRRVRQHLLTDPLHTIGVRDYAPDDSIRHMHWKASARLQSPQVKVFEPTVELQTGLFLNLDTFERYWEGMDSVRVESAIITAASIASDLLNKRALVGLSANAVMTGSDQNLRIPPGRGPRQLESILEGLARLSPMAVSNFPRLLTSGARRYPAGSTIVVIACIMTAPLEIALQTLIENAQRVVLVRVGEIPVPNLPRLHVVTVPEDLSWQRRTSRHRYARTIRTGVLGDDSQAFR